MSSIGRRSGSVWPSGCWNSKSRATGTGAASRIDSPWGRYGAGRRPRAHAGRWCPCASARARRSGPDADAPAVPKGEDQPREKADKGVEGAQQGKERRPRNLPNGEGLVVSGQQRQPSLQVRRHTRCGSRGSRQWTISTFARRMPRRHLPAVAARHSPYQQKCVATFFNGGLKCAGDGRRQSIVGGATSVGAGVWGTLTMNARMRG